MQQGGRGGPPAAGSHGPKKKKVVGPLLSPVANKAKGAAKKGTGAATVGGTFEPLLGYEGSVAPAHGVRSVHIRRAKGKVDTCEVGAAR